MNLKENMQFSKIKCIILLAIIYQTSSTSANYMSKVESLEKLINNTIKEAESYKLRKNNDDYFTNYTSKNSIFDYGTFDFIVVGGGSSGSVVAARLIEVKKWRVLLVEAGCMTDELTEIPYFYPLLQKSDKNWGYNLIPQKNGCFGWKNNSCHLVRGKILGGTGSLNAVQHIRANKADHDKWANDGNPGWSFDDILPYYKKSENFESANIDLKYRGSGGPINVAYVQPLVDSSNWLSAAAEIGIKHIDDYNSESQLGISLQQKNIKFGKRVSGATAYVIPSMNQCNFNVTLNSLVTEILINKTNKKAYGITFMKNGKQYRALAEKEIIVSAGAVNSPQLLMLSGIGPKEELKRHQIDLVMDLPVGKYSKDHFLFEVYYRTNRTAHAKSLKDLLLEYLNGRGELTNTNIGLANSFLSIRNRSSTLPDIEIAISTRTPLTMRISGYFDHIKPIDDYYDSINEQTDFCLEIYLLHPKSTGTLTLKSKYPNDFPLIDAAIFSHSDDIEALYEVVQRLDKINQNTSPTFRKLNATRIEMPFCDHYGRNTKKYWHCGIQHLGVPALHTSSTVKMGPKTDPFAVVNHELKVYGIKNLRVVDCSVMPSTISGHNNAVAFMIGEKAAEMIKNDYDE